MNVDQLTNKPSQNPVPSRLHETEVIQFPLLHPSQTTEGLSNIAPLFFYEKFQTLKKNKTERIFRELPYVYYLDSTIMLIFVFSH